MRVSRHMPALDGVRGLAILMVFAVHYGEILDYGSKFDHLVSRGLDPFWSGVDLFFVLSGFLITGILLDTKGSPDYFSRFYWRRAVRIVPLYFAFLTFVFLMMRPFYQLVLHRDLWAGESPWWYVTYMANWKANHADGDAHISHLWSLAVEEQFYLVWPLIIFLCSRRRFAVVCAVVAASALAIRTVLVALHAPNSAIYRLTVTRMDALAIGAFAAFIARGRWADAARRFTAPVGALALLLVTGIGIHARSLDFGNPLTQTVGTSALDLTYGCLVYAAAAWNGTGPLTPLGWGWLRAVGRYSYCIYVIHMTPHLILMKHANAFIDRMPLILQSVARLSYPVVMFLGVFAVAKFSWHYFEAPLLKLKDAPFRSRFGRLQVPAA